MTKRLRVVIPTALAAATMFLAGCGEDDPAGAAGPSSTTPTTETKTETVTSTSDAPATTPEATADAPAPSAGDDLQPVACGPVDVDSDTTHNLVADPAENGIVGCTEAFNVLDEFLTLPPEKRSEASLGNVDLASGWSCTVDDGVTASISCVKEPVGDGWGFALHTDPVAA